VEEGYFDTGHNSLEYNPFLHLWSLGVEEQFYFLFPLLFLVMYAKRRAPIQS
jgi:peptidoglycan/LPS O-acetylase OafA/YrhL